MIIEQITVGEMEVFCYVVACDETREAAAIDPAGDKDDIEKIISVLEEKDLLGARDLEAVAEKQEAIVEDAVEFAVQSPLPDPAELEGAQYAT